MHGTNRPAVEKSDDSIIVPLFKAIIEQKVETARETAIKEEHKKVIRSSARPAIPPDVKNTKNNPSNAEIACRMLKYFKNITLLLIALLHGLFSMLCNILSNKTITIYITFITRR